MMVGDPHGNGSTPMFRELQLAPRCDRQLWSNSEDDEEGRLMADSRQLTDFA